MDTGRFKEVVEQHIQRLFPGSVVTPHPRETATDRRHRRKYAFLRNQTDMVVRPALSVSVNEDYNLHRGQGFAIGDAAFVETLIKGLNRDGKVSEEAFYDLINPTIRRSVAISVCPTASQVITRILEQFESWSEQTYEGRRIAAAVGIDPTSEETTDVQVEEVYKESFGAVLASGVDSFVVCSKNGSVLEYKSLEILTESGFAPFRFAAMAHWANNKKVAIGLNRYGEVLIFGRGELIFAKRRGNWHRFSHRATAKAMSLNAAFEPQVRNAVYTSCLDASFARTGGCIAVVRRNAPLSQAFKDTVKPKDLIETSSDLKARCMKQLIGGRFQDLDRRLRQDLLAIDGATVLDYKGHILAVGAIVRVTEGSDSGARTAAAKAMSAFGLAVKVSSDGEITAYSVPTGQTTVKRLFTIG